MLIFEKIQEINTLLQNLESKQSKFESNETSALTQKFNALKNELTNALNTQKNQIQSELATNLTAQNTSQKDNLRSQITTELASAKNTLNTTLKAEVTQSAQSEMAKIKQALSTEIESHITRKMDSALEQVIENITADKAFKEQIKENLAENLKNQVRASVRELDLESYINYDALKIDYEKIKGAVLDSEKLATALNETAQINAQKAQEQITQYISDHKALEDSINEIGLTNAQEIFKAAMSADELMKMRLETMLYLQSLRLYGLDKQILDIASTILRPVIKREKQNIYLSV